MALSKSTWYFEIDDDPADGWFVPNSWLDEDGDADPWFEFRTLDPSDATTWLAHYIEPSSERQAMGIIWRYHKLYVRDYKSVLNDCPNELEAISQAGFRNDGGKIFLPISFNADLISIGLTENDLSEALAPIEEAAAALQKALPAFNGLRQAMLIKSSNNL